MFTLIMLVKKYHIFRKTVENFHEDMHIHRGPGWPPKNGLSTGKYAVKRDQNHLVDIVSVINRMY